MGFSSGAKARHAIGGEAFTSSGLPSLAIEHAGNDGVGMMHCQAAHQLDGLLVRSDGSRSGSFPNYVEFGHSAGLPSQHQMPRPLNAWLLAQ
jgi:hypothetical protein